MTEDVERTPLHAALAELAAVEERVGLFDAAHLGEVVFEGPDALAAVQFLVTSDVSKLADGKALYTVMCAEHGGIVDDVIVHRDGYYRILVWVNAGRLSDDLAHMKAVIRGYRVKIAELSEDHEQLARHRLLAEALLCGLTPADLSAVLELGKTGNFLGRAALVAARARSVGGPTSGGPTPFAEDPPHKRDEK